MTRKNNSENSLNKLDQSGDFPSLDTIKQSEIKKELQIFLQEVNSLSYEECLQSLDTLLERLQNDDILLQELEISYLKGKIYFFHLIEIDYYHQPYKQSN